MSDHESGQAVVIERVQLRRVNASLAFASVRLPGVNLSGMRVEERPDGHLTCTPPEQVGRDGRRWPAWALQPGWREGVEREIACLWARSA